MSKELRNLENQLINLEVDNRTMKTKLSEMRKVPEEYLESNTKLESDNRDITKKDFKNAKEG